jgi:hypothetical protein
VRACVGACGHSYAVDNHDIVMTMKPNVRVGWHCTSAADRWIGRCSKSGSAQPQGASALRHDGCLLHARGSDSEEGAPPPALWRLISWCFPNSGGVGEISLARITGKAHCMSCWDCRATSARSQRVPSRVAVGSTTSATPALSILDSFEPHCMGYGAFDCLETTSGTTEGLKGPKSTRLAPKRVAHHGPLRRPDRRADAPVSGLAMVHCGSACAVTRADHQE